MSQYLPYYLGFSHFLGIGPVRFKQLIDQFGTAENAYNAKREILQPLLGLKLTDQFISFRLQFKPDEILSQLSKKNIHVITLEDKHYPLQLAAVSDPPICLYVVGSVEALTQSADRYFAIVGTRRATSYGLQIARQFSTELSHYGFIIVSGLALGIDSASHWGAIESKGITIAVLGCGVDIIYPPSNKTLYEKIVASGGAVISEFPPGHRVAKGLFVARNRVISGLSRGVLVVEGSENSGALITARYAGEQGRDVFAPPSPITSSLSQAPNLLLKQGAKIVTSVADITDEYNITTVKMKNKPLIDNLGGLQKNLVEYLVEEPLTADDLKLKLKQPVDVILNHLTLLELEGVVTKNSEGKYMCKFN